MKIVKRHRIRQYYPGIDKTIYIYCPVWRETRRFVPPWKFMSPEGEARGRHEFSGWDKSSCLPTNWAINCLLYRKLWHDVIQRRALCRETRKGNTTSGGKHDDLFSLHVTSLDQSYFFIRNVNSMRYNNRYCTCTSPSTTMHRLFLKHCTLANKAMGTTWRALYRPPRRQGHLWLLVWTPTALGLKLAYRLRRQKPAFALTWYFLNNTYMHHHLCD